jgi:uncharacterized membrane protein
MRRTLIFVFAGLLLGGVIHIVVVLLVPYYAGRDAWSALARFGRDGEFHILPRPEAGAEALPALDPRMLYAVCRFSLASGPIRIRASLPDDFWSIAVFDRRGRNAYSLNDRAAERSQLDLAVITPVQMAQLRQDPPASLETAVVVELPIEVGFVVLRVFAADDSEVPGATAALQTADCAGTL